MKLLHLLLVMLFPCMIFSQNQFVLNDSNIVFINELHYDNVAGDSLEGIEIAALSGTDLSCYKVYFVNGNKTSHLALKLILYLLFFQEAPVLISICFLSSSRLHEVRG